jgi:ABC-2 type transport system permease protein
MVAITTAVFGLLPRFTPVAWGVLVAFVAIYLLGSLANSPQWLLDLEPFTHTPRVGSGDFTATPLLWLLVLDIALIVLSTLTFRRRDLH